MNLNMKGSGYMRLVVIPAYNEGHALPGLLDAVARAVPDADICLVDDGSSDSTRFIPSKGRLHVIRHVRRMGYGMALKSGFEFALRKSYSVVATMDGDGQHDPLSLPSLFSAVESGSCDVAVGSRFLNGSSYPLGPVRRAGVKLLRAAVRMIVGENITDPTSGFMAFSSEVLPFLAGDKFPRDYPDANLLIMLFRLGFRVSEVPVHMRPNPRGRSMHNGLKGVHYAVKMAGLIAAAAIDPTLTGRDHNLK